MTDVFPYGFVVRRVGSTTTRELPANPDEDQFDGIVTFAYKVPLQETPAQDPFTVTIMFLAVDDDEVKITQSVEEATSTGVAAFDARATSLGATRIRLLPWGTSASSSYERFCSVRIAGPASNPTAYLASAPGNLVSLSPHPFTASASSIPANAQFAATFDRAVSGVSPQHGLIVHGNQSGRRFVGDVFAGHGTTTISTPVADFFPGEEVEVGFASSIRRSPCSDDGFPGVYRYRVATNPSSGSFTAESPLRYGHAFWAVALGDVDGDGDLDVVVLLFYAKEVLVLLNQGNGTFSHHGTWSTGPVIPRVLSLGDLDGDGDLDIVVTSAYANRIHVLRNGGNQQFTVEGPMGFAPGGVGLADLGDLDGDGDLDLVLKHSFANTISVLFNQGNGTFAGRSTYAVGDGPTGLALGDLNGDGYLDVVVSNYWSNSISVLINQGDNTFGDQRTYVTGSGPLRIVTVDLDGDGDLDLAYTTDEAGTVSVWFNRGDATFDDPANHSIPLASGMSPLVAGDLDGDGDMDLVAGNRNTGDIAILLNRGNGSFDVRTFSTDGQPRLLALGDLDVSGDGALDLVILSDLRSRANAPEVVVLLNR